MTESHEAILSRTQGLENKKGINTAPSENINYRKMLEEINDVIYYIDKNRIIKYINPAIQRIMGVPSEEMIGKDFLSFIHEDDIPRLKKSFRKITSDNIQPGEYRIVTNTGEIRWIRIYSHPCFVDGKFTGIQGVITDITERKRAEESIKASESKFRRLYESMMDAYAYVALDGSILEFNEAYRNMLGYEPDELYQMTYVDITPEKWHTIEAEIIEKQVNVNGHSDLYEKEYRRKDGTIFPIEISTFLVRDDQNQPCGYWGIVRDITDRKRAELRSQRRLERGEQLGHLQQSLLTPGETTKKLKLITDGILEIFGADFCRIWCIGNGDLCDSGCLHAAATEEPHICHFRDKCLRLIASSGRYTHTDGLVHRRVPFGAYKIGLVASGAEHKFLTNDVTHDPRVHDHDWARELGLASFAGYQLRSPGGETTGVLALFSSHIITPEEDAQLDALSSAAAQVIHAGQTEEALRKKTEQLQMALGAARMGVWQHDLQSDVITTIQGSGPISGLPEGVYPKNLETLMALVHPEDREMLGQRLWQAAEKKADFDVEFRLSLPDDIIRWVATQGRFTYDAGRSLLLRGVDLDITDRKMVEEELRQSEEKYRTVIENMQDVFYRTDLKGNLIMLSPSGAQYLGFESVEQLYGINIANELYAYSEDRTRFLQELRAKGEVRDYEVALRRTDGTIFFASANSHFYYDSNGKLLGVEGILRDINERKKTLETLRASEERYRLLIENASEAIFVIQDFKIAFSNNKLGVIFGYSNEDVIEKNFIDYIHPDDKDIVVNRLMARIEGTQMKKPTPFRVLASNGSYKWLEVDAVKFLWNGKPATLNFATDVTDQIIAQNDLKENEIKFRTIFEHSSDAAFLGTDILLDCNQKACELWDCERADIIGHSPLEFSPLTQPDGRDSAKAIGDYIVAALDGHPQYFYWQHKKKNGTPIDTEVSLKVLTINDNRVLHGVIRDISQRKRAEETLRRLATAVEQSADGIVIMNTQGIIEYVNPAFEKITGRARDEVTGPTPSFLEPLNQGSILSREIWAKLRIGQSWSGTFISHKKDGTSFNEEITISPVFDSLGTIMNFIAVKRDITRQTALEQQLLQSQKMEAIGRLAGGVAHDFNNLLSVIIGYSEILYRKLSGQDSLQSDIEEIRKAGERAASLTRQLLAFSRKQIIQPKVLNLNAVVTDMNKMLKRLIGENIVLMIEIEPELWAVNADPGQIEQIVMNLAINARDAMPDGGKLVIKTANVPSANRNHEEKPNLGDSVNLIVSDNGAGIPDDIRAHIFEPFFTTKEQGKGTGLGLSTVYGIVQQNHGHTEVESKVGLGTSFIIYLPKHSDEPGKTGKIEIQKILSSGSETILVVEDEEIVRNLTCRILGELGYKTIAFEKPIEAVEACLKSANNIDLVLTDIVMPEMNGDELSRRIKESNPDMKILFMSGYTDNAFISHEILESQADFIQKPFKKDVLAMKVREVLDRKAAIIESRE